MGFHLSLEIMEFCSQLLISWLNISTCGDSLWEICASVPRSTENNCHKIVFESKQMKGLESAAALQWSTPCPQSLLWSVTVLRIFNSLSFFAITTLCSHLSLLLWTCQSLKVNALEIRARKDVKKKKKKAKELPWGTERGSHLLSVWVGLKGVVRQLKGDNRTKPALQCPFMLS